MFPNRSKSVATALRFKMVAVTAIAMGGLFITSRANAAIIVTTETFNAVNATYVTIPNTSSTDAAQSATFTSVGTPHGASGPISVLHDGVAGVNGNGTAGIAFFSDTSDLSITVNLGGLKNITQVNTYSSDTAASNNRAAQRYSLWGSTDGVTYTVSPIASVANNGGVYQSTGTAHSYGNSINDAVAGTLGTYQYLRFDLTRLGVPTPLLGTFLDEIDVVGTAVAAPEPSSVLFLTAGGLTMLVRRRRH